MKAEELRPQLRALVAPFEKLQVRFDRPQCNSAMPSPRNEAQAVMLPTASPRPRLRDHGALPSPLSHKMSSVVPLPAVGSPDKGQLALGGAMMIEARPLK